MINDRPEVVTDINVPFPEDEALTLVIAVGACKLRIVPGTETWVSGTYTTLEGIMPLKIEQHNGTLRISQEIGLSTRMRNAPRFDLQLGTARAYRLKLETGASECELDVGGLPLTEVLIRQGAAAMVMNFSAPNPQVMSQLILECGAGSSEIRNLSNAAFEAMTIDGGAGSYKLDFGVPLMHDATLAMHLGASSIDLSVPQGTAVAMKTETMMGSINARGFEKRGNTYANRAAIDESRTSPLLRVKAQMAMGSLNLREK